MHDIEAGLSCQRDGFVGGYVEHAPARRHRPVAQGHEDEPAHSHQGGDVGHRSPTLVPVEMHPHRGHHHDVEGLAARRDHREVGETVVDPFDRPGRV
ncbi:MAG TPA: hypothetical protein VGG57_01000 [Stellaceae bacterium]|jgi:hypothetical protein